MGRLFGTDGARGVANSELTCELAMKIGRATAMVLTDSTHKRPRVLIGMDTRASSEMLEAAISAGRADPGSGVPCSEISVRCGHNDFRLAQPLRI